MKRLALLLLPILLISCSKSAPDIFDGRIDHKEHLESTATHLLDSPSRVDDFNIYIWGPDANGNQILRLVVTDFDGYESFGPGDCVHVDYYSHPNISKIECR